MYLTPKPRCDDGGDEDFVWVELKKTRMIELSGMKKHG
jgi:hypothetical protein